MRRELLEQIEDALKRNESQQASIIDMLDNRKLKAAERASQEQELGRLEAAIDALKTKRRELALPTGGATHEIGGDEAHDAELMLDDARGDLSRNFSDIMRRYSELDAERTRISQMKKNLALREQWLKDNPPPTE